MVTLILSISTDRTREREWLNERSPSSEEERDEGLRNTFLENTNTYSFPQVVTVTGRPIPYSSSGHQEGSPEILTGFLCLEKCLFRSKCHLHPHW